MSGVTLSAINTISFRDQALHLVDKWIGSFLVGLPITSIGRCAIILIFKDILLLKKITGVTIINVE
jgi:hypothetical protein